MRLFRGTVYLVTLPGVQVSRFLERWAVTRLTQSDNTAAHRALPIAILPFLISSALALGTIRAAFALGQDLAASSTPQPAGLLAFLALSWVGLAIAIRSFPSAKLAAALQDCTTPWTTDWGDRLIQTASTATRLIAYSRHLGLPVLYALTLYTGVYLTVTIDNLSALTATF